VPGCLDSRMQVRLLGEPELTVAKTVDLCRAPEATNAQMQSINDCAANPAIASSVNSLHHSGRLIVKVVKLEVMVMQTV